MELNIDTCDDVEALRRACALQREELKQRDESIGALQMQLATLRNENDRLIAAVSKLVRRKSSAGSSDAPSSHDVGLSVGSPAGSSVASSSTLSLRPPNAPVSVVDDLLSKLDSCWGDITADITPADPPSREDDAIWNDGEAPGRANSHRTLIRIDSVDASPATKSAPLFGPDDEPDANAPQQQTECGESGGDSLDLVEDYFHEDEPSPKENRTPALSPSHSSAAITLTAGTTSPPPLESSAQREAYAPPPNLPSTSPVPITNKDSTHAPAALSHRGSLSAFGTPVQSPSASQTAGSLSSSGAGANPGGLSDFKSKVSSIFGEVAEHAVDSIKRKLRRQSGVATEQAMKVYPAGQEATGNATFYQPALEGGGADGVSGGRAADVAFRAVAERKKTLPGWLIRYWLRAEPHKNATGRVAKVSSSLVDLLLCDNLSVATALGEATQSTELDELSKCLMRVFEGVGESLAFLSEAIRAEVARTSSANTLFRSNSLASKCLTVYCRMIGKPYLQETLGKTVRRILAGPSFEISPEKAAAGTDLEANLRALEEACRVMLDRILAGLDAFPAPLRRICAVIRREVNAKFPGRALHGVGGFVFLRYFCPALVSPEGFHFVRTPPTAEARRNLILVSKVLQNLANGVEFGAKEHFMIPLNSFIQQSTPKLMDYFDRLSTVTDDVMRQAEDVYVDMPKSLVDGAVGQVQVLMGLAIDGLAVRLADRRVVEAIAHSPADDIAAILRGFGGKTIELVLAQSGLFDSFEEILLTDGQCVLRCMFDNVPSKHMDDLARAAIQLLAADAHAMTALVVHYLQADAQAAASPAALQEFTTGSRLLASYARFATQDYLRTTLRDIVQEVCATRKSFEVDPARAMRDENIRENMERLMTTSLKFLGAIANSVVKFPIDFRRLCNAMYTAIEARFPGEGEGAVSRFLFMRYFCPAIASPSVYGLISTTPSATAHRGLVLVSYTLRNVASGTQFKDLHMTDLNALLATHATLLFDFVRKVVDVPREEGDSKAPTATSFYRKALETKARPMSPVPAQGPSPGASAHGQSVFFTPTSAASAAPAHASSDSENRIGALWTLQRILGDSWEEMQPHLQSKTITETVSYHIFDRLSSVLAVARKGSRREGPVL